MADRSGNKPRERTPLHRQNVLTIPQRAGFIRRLVNDSPGRISQFLAAGWTIVVGDTSETHDGHSTVESQMGSQVRRGINKSGRGTVREAVLMEIPEEYYHEDQAEKARLIKQQEDLLTRNGDHTKPGFYGDAKISRDKL